MRQLFIRRKVLCIFRMNLFTVDTSVKALNIYPMDQKCRIYPIGNLSELTHFWTTVGSAWDMTAAGSYDPALNKLAVILGDWIISRSVTYLQ